MISIFRQLKTTAQNVHVFMLSRLAYSIPVEPESVCPCVSTLSNMNISATGRPNSTIFYLKHHWGGGKAALGFGPGRIATLVSMATNSCYRVIMGKIL